MLPNQPAPVVCDMRFIYQGGRNAEANQTRTKKKLKKLDCAKAAKSSNSRWDADCISKRRSRQDERSISRYLQKECEKGIIDGLKRGECSTHSTLHSKQQQQHWAEAGTVSQGRDGPRSSNTRQWQQLGKSRDCLRVIMKCLFRKGQVLCLSRICLLFRKTACGLFKLCPWG